MSNFSIQVRLGRTADSVSSKRWRPSKEVLPLARPKRWDWKSLEQRYVYIYSYNNYIYNYIIRIRKGVIIRIINYDVLIVIMCVCVYVCAEIY